MGWPHCRHCRHCAWCVRVCVCVRVRLPGLASKVPGREDPDVLQGKDSKEGPSSTRFGSADYGHRPRYFLSLECWIRRHKERQVQVAAAAETEAGSTCRRCPTPPSSPDCS